MAALTIQEKHSNPNSVFDKETLYDTDKKTMAVSLPQDVILFQILTRVPTKSVIRFKSVSEQWNSFLISDRFKDMHIRNLLKDPHLENQNLFFYSTAARTFFTIDCESLPNKAPCARPLPRFEASPPRYMFALTSYHGLVCLRITPDTDSYYIFWNPLTTEYKRLSKPYCGYYCGYGLYYSSGEDDYKLLAVRESRGVYIYSLKYDSWRRLNIKSPFKRTDFWGPRICCEENLYFLSHKEHPSLIRFDTKAERFDNIKIPFGFHNKYNRQLAITVHKGSIHLCVKYNIGRDNFLITNLELWKFDADGDIWSKVVTYQLMLDFSSLSPLHLMSNGNWIMEGYSGICQVELKKKHTEDKDGYDEYKLYHYSNFTGQPQIYTEMFVSPNRYTK